ncbi:autotransporter domain-containing protein [Bradyrhizobium sp. SYSU BS000235]|uniref:autotransporter domain-containing protein n=1 Tax=Bradyrhizobium sp. SYSU BS000235 TaxID=3411332 RepID=UPI003C7912C0
MNSTALLRLCRAGCLSVALTSVLLAMPALADGGRGSAEEGSIVGGTDSITGTGGNGAPADLGDASDGARYGNGGSGGGAGATGGQGGTNTQGGTAAGGSSPGAAGADAFASGGGGGGAHGWVDSILPGMATTGGNGGRGGDASDMIYPSFAAGGGGGAGGYGVVFTGLAGTLSASANVTGGNGGDGGDAELNVGNDRSGSGGSGGVGLYVVDAATLILNAEIKGGRGGAGGTALTGFASAIGGAGGTGGAGISAQSGATLTINAAVMGGAGGAGGAASAPGNSQNAFAGNAGDGGAGVLAQSATVTINAAVTAGGGGAGGAAASHQAEARGGTGGAGAAGVSAQSSTVTINAAVTGGDGGAGGSAVTDDWGLAHGGGGGVGGAGVSARSGTVTINSVVTGGHGGAGGSASGGLNGGGNGGDGGVGIIGPDITVVNNGSISGGLGGDGTTRANAVTFTGGNNVYEMWAGSSVTGNVVGTGSDTFQLGGTVSSTFDLTQLNTSQYQGFSHLSKSGSSTWTLTNSSGWTSDVAISGGTLFVQDSLANASLITVSGTGTLAGTGPASTVHVNAGGTFAPGNGTPGNGTLGSSMMVDSLAMQSGAFYKVFLNPTTSSFANVTGSATLNGATVNANFASGSYVVKQYTILTAGSITGEFDAAVINTNLPSGFKTSLSYDVAKTKAYLDLALDIMPPSSGGGNNGLPANQSNVGNAITNYANSHTGIPMAFGGLTPQGLTQVSGEIGGSAQGTSAQASTQFMNIMSDPTAAGRGGVSGGAGASGYADEAMAYAAKRSNNPRDAFASFTKAPPQSFVQRWSTWAMGYGGSQTTDGNAVAGTNTSSSNIYGVAVGADYNFSPDTIAGFALSGGGTNYSVVNGGTGRSDMFQLGAFVRHNIGATYLTASAAYGWQDVKTDRYVTVAGVDHLKAEFNTNSYSGRLEVGHRFLQPWFGGLGVSPYAAVQVTAFELPAYAEQAVTGNNTFALAYGANTSTATRSELGLRTDKSYALDGAVLTLRGRAAWAHDFNPNSAVSATFQSLPGASFVVNGAALAPDAALTTASAEVSWMNGWSVAATFEGEFSDVTRSYAGKGVVRYNW